MRARAGQPVREPPARADTRSAGSGYCRARGGSRGLLPQAGAARLICLRLLASGPRTRSQLATALR